MRTCSKSLPRRRRFVMCSIFVNTYLCDRECKLEQFFIFFGTRRLIVLPMPRVTSKKKTSISRCAIFPCIFHRQAIFFFAPIDESVADTIGAIGSLHELPWPWTRHTSLSSCTCVSSTCVQHAKLTSNSKNNELVLDSASCFGSDRTLPGIYPAMHPSMQPAN